MNYYKRHLGDYAKDTGFLSTYQHGCYALLLDWYYSNEKPIPMAIAYRIVRARTGPEKRACDEVLNTFFDVSKGDGFAHCKRADIEISNKKCKGEANSLIAQEAWDAKRMRNAYTNAYESPQEKMPSHKPLAISHKEQEKTEPNGSVVASKATPCPHMEIIALYHELLPSLARVREWTEARQKTLRKRWLEKPDRQDLEWWKRFFAYVGESDFLMGRKTTRSGEPFDCDLEWLIRPRNFVKVIEGRYENRRTT